MRTPAVLPVDETIEYERYEMRAGLHERLEITRRELFRAAGGGLLVLCLLPEACAQQESGRRGGFRQQLPEDIGAWLHVGADGSVTGFTGKVEIGQNIRTSLSQAIAEELRVGMDSVRLTMADTSLTPFDMGTFGSRTTPTMAPQLRSAAAAAREALIDMAAARWGVDRAGLRADNGRITDSQGNRAAGYGELTQGRSLTKVIGADPNLTSPAAWKIEGQSAPKVGGRDFVTGRHKYTSDLKRPGMLYGRVLRPAAFQANLVSVDTSQAEKIPGVKVARDGDFVGVSATDQYAADQAVAAITARWNAPSQPSSADLFRYLKSNPSEERGGFGGRSANEAGSVVKGLSGADVKLQATYTVAYIAHAPLEPRASLAEWDGDRLTVWTGTQRPFAVRSELASTFGIPEANVRVIVPDMGSGYGGKHTAESAIETARLAKAAGRPVKMVWTREEEFTWAYFRPAGVIDVSSGAKQDGALTAWEFDNYNSGPSAIDTPYEVPNRRIEFHPTRSPLRQGSYRALAATANHFARESHMDELAHALKLDPVAFRRKNLKDPRLIAVLDAAVERFKWPSEPRVAGTGVGVSCGVEKGGYVAACVEAIVDRQTGKVRVARVVEAFDCGAVMNPDHLKNQIEGAVMMGLGGALFENIRFADGRILNPLFSRYRVPRFSDMPAIEVVLVDRRDVPSSGAGETPIVGIAPALGNAIFDATGARLRSLPMAPDGVKA